MFHDLRHKPQAASSRSLNPMQVAAITGHKTLQMLKRYTHLKAEDLAELLKGVAEFTRDTLVTKGDLSEAKTEIKAEITLLKWMVGFGLGLSLLILGKLFFHIESHSIPARFARSEIKS